MQTVGNGTRRILYQRLVVTPEAALDPLFGGLGELVSCSLGRALCKDQQCSDWSARPLSPEQVRYAALDAHVLLSLLGVDLGASQEEALHPEALAGVLHRASARSWQRAKPRLLPLGPEAVDEALRKLKLPICEVTPDSTEAIHCKTLALVGLGDEEDRSRRAVAVLSTSSQLSLVKASTALGFKVRLARRQLLPALFGYEVGGMGPFGLRATCPLLLDETLRESQELLVGGGSPGRDLLVPQVDVASADAAQRLRGKVMAGLSCKEAEWLLDSNFRANDEVCSALRLAWDCAVRLEAQLGEADRPWEERNRWLQDLAAERAALDQRKQELEGSLLTAKLEVQTACASASGFLAWRFAE
ncbi:unnamed protein product, partial [Effrenium voratum]